MENIHKGGLPGVIELIKQTREVVQNHWRNLVRFFLLNSLLSFGVAALMGATLLAVFLGGRGGVLSFWGGLGIMGVVAIIVVLVVIVLSIWIQTAFFESLRALRQDGRQLGFREAFQLAHPRMWSWAWVGVLSGLAILGGTILLIVPGIIFFVWFFLSPYVFVNENISGTAALKKSKQYVSGKWWKIFGRIVGGGVLVWIVVSIPTLILGVIARELGILGVLLEFIVNIVANLFIQLFIMVYIQLLYEAVRADSSAITSGVSEAV